MSRTKAIRRKNDLDEAFRTLRLRSDDFPFKTHLDEVVISEIQKAGSVELSAEQIQSIANDLKEYEFIQRLHHGYEYGKKLRQVLKRLESDLDEVIEIARLLDNEVRGHLWNFMRDKANVFGALNGLQDIRAELKKLNDATDAARNTREENNALILLLERLERIFLSAGGKSTRISRGTSDKRTGKFVLFCEEAIKALPTHVRPKSVGPFWERVLLQRKRPAKSGYRNWIGRLQSPIRSIGPRLHD